MKLPNLQDHVLGSYTATRLGVALIGALLPFALVIGGMMLADLELQDSMSAYYHAGDGAMRDVFVGALFAVGAILVLYRGYTPLEDIALNIGGASLIGVGLVPMEWECTGSCGWFSWHGFLAVLFFFSIAYVCLRRASDTVALIEEQGREGSAERAARYRITYRVLGAVLLASPMAAWVLASALDPDSPTRRLTFFAEALGVLVFAVYWMVKSYEIRESRADELAVLGFLTTPDSGLDKVAKPMPVTLRSMVEPKGNATGLALEA